MVFLVLADIGDTVWTGGSGVVDAVVSCGDVDDRVILAAATAFGGPPIFAVKGNHDHPSPFPPPITDLHLGAVDFRGLRLAGFNGCHRYKPRGHFLYEEAEAAAKLAALPAVDILVCHNSPLGVHDQEDAAHRGFDALNAYLSRARPRLLLHGHQHTNRQTQNADTTIIGVFGGQVVKLYYCLDNWSSCTVSGEPMQVKHNWENTHITNKSTECAPAHR